MSPRVVEIAAAASSARCSRSFAAFQDPAGDFIERDLYIFVFGPDRTLVAHGGNPQLVGTPASTLVDVEAAWRSSAASAGRAGRMADGGRY